MLTYLTAFALVTKQLFMRLESLTNIMQEFGELKIYTREIERDSPKVNVLCGLLCNKVIGPFFFDEKTVTADIYLYTRLTSYTLEIY